MAGRIVIVRESGWTGLVAVRLAVRVDGTKVGRFPVGARQDVEVRAGQHHVRVNQFGYRPKALVVNVADDETVVVRFRLRTLINLLGGFMGSLIGGSAYWLTVQGPTPPRLAAFTAGVAGVIAVYLSGLAIHVQPDPPDRSQT